MTNLITPSLAHTPTTVASSMSSVYDFNTRPLPMRHNPMYSASMKNVDLVTPYVAPAIAPMAASVPAHSNPFCEGPFDKKIVKKNTLSMPEIEGLGALLGNNTPTH